MTLLSQTALPPMSVIVVFENHHPHDMRLITFALRANRIPFQQFKDIQSCRNYLSEQPAQTQLSHVLLTDSDNFSFLKELSEEYPFCLSMVMVGRNLQVIFSNESMFNAINGFVARNDPTYGNYPQALIGATQRLINREFFGLPHFMTGPYLETSQVIQTTADSIEVLNQISRYVQEISQNQYVTAQVEGICDEIIMNALYDANPKYQFAERRDSIQLEESEKITVTYGCDGRMFAVAVADRFGRLGKETIYHYLRKCFFEENVVEFNGQGAGLGFFRILNAVNTLAINVIPDQRTEVVGVLDISLTRKAFQEVQKSFYYLKLEGFKTL